MPTETGKQSFSVTKDTKRFFVRGENEFVGELQFNLFRAGIMTSVSHSGNIRTINLLFQLTDQQVVKLREILSQIKTHELELSSTGNFN